MSSSLLLAFFLFPNIFGLAILLVAILAYADDLPSVHKSHHVEVCDHVVEDEDDGVSAK